MEKWEVNLRKLANGSYYKIKDYAIINGDNFLQVHQTKISFFINGLEKDNAAFDARTLSGSITDFASGTMQIGQSLNGEFRFQKIICFI